MRLAIRGGSLALYAVDPGGTMPKNVIIFSDGTGQAGGVRPDQQLSNIYKLYRASKVGPDSSVDPTLQTAFYDPGLGTDDDDAGAPTRLFRFGRKTLASVTGRGITRNITDCYEAILNTYEPGDRIFLFGFSRGAYTARSIAGVLSLCGVPTLGLDGRPLPRHKPETRAIADEAVRKVYEHGAGKPIGMYEAEREELGQRFRSKFGSDLNGGPNASPHFVGVFDTVASLGVKGIVRYLLGMALVGGVLATSFVAALGLHWLLTAPVGWSTATLSGLVLLLFVMSSLRSTVHVIRDWPTKGKWNWHIAKWDMKNYDRRLSCGVRYARHAISIDETRTDFPRVEWGFKAHEYVHVAGEPDALQQIWFAGNHSDIGGSYAEAESRLSDIALEWMIDQATSVSGGLVVDRNYLHTFPSASGMHCEVDAMRDKLAAYLPSWWPQPWKPTWKELSRKIVPGAPVHPSVLDRLGLPAVLKCGRFGPYRPQALADDERFSSFYSPGLVS
jgi:uncharacterized protein (DUF2235 family)